MNEIVLIDEREGAYWITLNRPEALNAINEPLIEGFLRAMDRIDDPARPLVVTGAGRAFSAGGDLKGYLAKLDAPQAMTNYFELLTRWFLRLADYPGVTLAAVNGVAVAGGLELMCVCDLAVAAESARLADGHINYGLHPGGGSSALLGRMIGERRARWLLLSGEFIGAVEAERIGLVNQVVPDADLEAAANRMAAAVSRHGASAVRRVKRLLSTGIEEALRIEHASLLEHFRAPETRERLEAFAARSKRDGGS
jgi:enoyl-CoA hydratase